MTPDASTARELGELAAELRQLREAGAERHHENTARFASMEAELAGVREPLAGLLQVRQVALWAGWCLTTGGGALAWAVEHFHPQLQHALASMAGP